MYVMYTTVSLFTVTLLIDLHNQILPLLLQSQNNTLKRRGDFICLLQMCVMHNMHRVFTMKINLLYAYSHKAKMFQQEIFYFDWKMNML